MPDLVMKRGDTTPTFRARCLDDTTPVDLSSAASVKLLMRRYGASTSALSATMVVEDQATSPGWVYRAWSPSDLSVAGEYHAEVEVTWANGTVQTFPPTGWVTIRVADDLG